MYAKSLGDELIVGVLNDHLAGEGAYISEDLRLESVKNNSIIDKAFLISDGVKEAILSLKPDYVVNFAAQGMVAESWLNPTHWYKTNVVSQVAFHDELRKRKQKRR